MNQKDIHKLKTIYTTILESKGDSGPPYVNVYSNGDKYYYKTPKMTILHREDGPAIEHVNGHKEWWINGKLHRTDGPAIEYADGGKDWYINGKLHREDGPAIENSNGIKRWYLNGKLLTEKEFKAYFANKRYKASHDTTTDFEEFDI